VTITAHQGYKECIGVLIMAEEIKETEFYEKEALEKALEEEFAEVK